MALNAPKLLTSSARVCGSTKSGRARLPRRFAFRANHSVSSVIQGGNAGKVDSEITQPSLAPRYSAITLTVPLDPGVQLKRSPDTSCEVRLRKHMSNGIFSLLLDLFQVSFIPKTLGVNFVNILRAGWPCGKPSILGDHLDSAERDTVTRSGGLPREYRFTRQFLHADLIRCNHLQQIFLLDRRGSVDSLIKGPAQFFREAVVGVAWIPFGSRGYFGGQQTENEPVLIGRPHRSVSTQERRTCTLLPGESE